MIGTRDEVIQYLQKQDNTKKYEAKEHKEKRSKDANAYFHVLVNKLARYFNISDEEMKIEMNLSYGTLAKDENGMVKGCKVPESMNMKEFYQYAKWYKKDGDCDCYLFYKQTHTLNTQEMAQLINGVVQECENAGIETKSKAEIDSLLKEWK